MSDTERTSAPEQGEHRPRYDGSGASRQGAPRRRSRRGRASTVQFRGAQTYLLIVVGIVAVLVLAFLADVAFTQGKIHPGVSVGGVEVGYLTPEQAAARLTDSFAETSETPVVVSSEDDTWDVSAESISAHLDATASVAAAMAVGRTGGPIGMLVQRLGASFGGAEVTATVVADEGELTALLDKIEGAIRVPSQDASVSIEGSKVRLIPSKAGDALDRGATAAAVLSGFVHPSHEASVVVVAAAIRVSDENARQAFEDAKKLVAGPVKVTYKNASHTLDQSTVSRSVRFIRVPASGTATTDASGTTQASTATTGPLALVASFDATKVGDAIAPITEGLTVKARDARFVASGGRVTIKPSRDGRGPDLQALAAAMTTACLSGEDRTAELTLTTVEPALTTAAAHDMGIANRISTYTTYYAASAKPRVNNIHLLADALNMKLVAPGATFSFNKTAGERTAAKGYQEAPAIVKGKLVPQLGGGVCQVGTTFFNAVFFSGLPVVERHNHSFYISHYPMGRDATVSWGGPDFKFKNDTGQWILIRASYTSGSLTISLYGTDPGYSVEYTTSDFTDPIPFKTNEIKDAKLKKGVRIIEDAGVKGGRVVVVRTVYKNGKVVRRDTFTSRYAPKTQTVRVGTKKSTPTTGTPTP